MKRVFLLGASLIGTVFLALWRVCPQLRTKTPVAPSRTASPRFEDLLDSSAAVRSAITTRDPAVLERALVSANAAYEEEERRTQVIEAKATTLLSVLGVTATLLAGSGTLLLDHARAMSDCLLGILVGVFTIAIGCLSMTVYRALGTMRVASFAKPDPTTVLGMQSLSAIDLQQQHLADLLVSHHRNSRINHEKAGWLRDAYAFLVVAVIGLLLAALIVALYAVLVGWGVAPGEPSQAVPSPRTQSCASQF